MEGFQQTIEAVREMQVMNRPEVIRNQTLEVLPPH
jgi:hypothetical protein